jgi:predicted RNA binding protein YcfA (HicA-like mRNA interferase family)
MPQVTCGPTPVPSLTLRVSMWDSSTAEVDQPRVPNFLVVLSEKSTEMPRKIRELIRDLTDAGFNEIRGGGKGSHRKWTHARYAGAVTLSGKTGDDAKPYQERHVKQAIEQVNR